MEQNVETIRQQLVDKLAELKESLSNNNFSMMKSINTEIIELFVEISTNTVKEENDNG